MTYPPVVVVDDQDRVIGEASLQEAWDKGLIHRVVYVIFENSRGQILLQRRASSMRLDPDCWDISASGHVDNGNSYARAAQLEVAEELGVNISSDILEEVAYFYTEDPYATIRTPKRFVKIYTAELEVMPTSLEAYEVSEVRWFTKGEITTLLENKPQEAAIGLQLCRRYILSSEQQMVA